VAIRLAALLGALLVLAGRAAPVSAAPHGFTEGSLMTVDGGGHEWPSFATQALWTFFAVH
jgi:polyhydroxybutyrate depolymerase